MTAPDVGDDELRELVDAIHARYGYDLRGYAAASLARRVCATLARTRIADVAELRRRVLADAGFFHDVLDGLTVRVSELFRDPAFYAALRARVVPFLRTYPLLRVWCGGCATGEEAYSMAILLAEEGLYERAQIYATDLSAAAIEQAKHGVFPAARLRDAAARHREAGGVGALEACFTVAYDEAAIRPALQRNILFFQHDLVVDEAFGEMHLILCRNVLIYFDRALQHEVLQKLARSLCPGGFLAVGASEHVRGEAPFAPYVAEQRIYRHVGS